jgi:hypothetical protein
MAFKEKQTRVEERKRQNELNRASGVLINPEPLKTLDDF